MIKLYILMIVVLIPTCAMGQESLNVSSFFSEAYAGRPEVTMVTLSGGVISGHRIEEFKSISVTGDSILSGQIRRAVGKDGAKAIDKAASYRNGQLYFGFYNLGGKGKSRQYLFYLDRHATDVDKVTLIYIRGDCSAEEVKRIIEINKQ